MITHTRILQTISISAITGILSICANRASAGPVPIPINDYNFSSPSLSVNTAQTLGNSGIEGWNCPGGTVAGIENDDFTGIVTNWARWTSTTLNNWPASDTGQALYVANNQGATNTYDFAFYDATQSSPGAPTWLPNTKYTLTLYYGEPAYNNASAATPADIALCTTYTAVGDTASHVLAYHNGITSTPGDLQKWSITATTGAAAPSGDLIIVLANADPETQAQSGNYTSGYFTDIQLTASPAPDPATGSLLVLGAGLVLLVSRRRLPMTRTNQ